MINDFCACKENRTMSNKSKIIGVIFFIVLGIGILGYLNFPKHPSNQITLYGNVELRQISLAFNASERITQLMVEEGDWVKEGQKIGSLDTRTLYVQIAKADAQIAAQKAALMRLENGSRPQEILQAKASVAAAKADVAKVRSLYSRYVKITKTTGGKGVSKQDVDEARAAYDKAVANLDNKQKTLELAEIGPRHEDIEQAKAELASAIAGLGLLKRQLEESTLYAPVDASVRARLLEKGDMASPQRPVYTLAITNPKWIRTYIHEAELGRVKLGMKASVVMDSYPNEPIDGQVGFISSNAEFTPKYVQTEELRTSLVYEIRIYVKDAANKLKLGMPVTTYLMVADNEQQ